MSSAVLPTILAEGGEDIMKFLFGLVFVAIWIIGGLASAAKKKKPRPEQERSWEQILQDLAGEKPKPSPPPAPVQPPPLPRTQQRATVAVPPPLPKAAKPKATRPRKIQPKRRQETVQTATQPTPFATATAPEELVPAVELSHAKGEIADTEIGTGRARPTASTASVQAAGIAQWLTPTNLRRQYILTEILQPPLALRETRNL